MPLNPCRSRRSVNYDFPVSKLTPKPPLTLLHHLQLGDLGVEELPLRQLMASTHLVSTRPLVTNHLIPPLLTPNKNSEAPTSPLRPNDNSDGSSDSPLLARYTPSPSRSTPSLATNGQICTTTRVKPKKQKTYPESNGGSNV